MDRPDPPLAPLIEQIVMSVLLGLAVVLDQPPSASPLLILAALLLSTTIVRNLWRDVAGTPLRFTVLWLCVTFGWGAVSQLAAFAEPLKTGRPWAAHLTYLTSLSALATLLSVLNARRPGAGAWSCLMVALGVVLLIPWLEAGGFSGRVAPHARLHVEMPWSLFLCVLAALATFNYIPTRHGIAAVVLLLGFSAELFALINPAMKPDQWPKICSIVHAFLLAGLLKFDPRLPAALRRAGRHGDRLWLWFRDHWGAAWGLRVRDRFNREADILQQSFRLTWRGLMPHGDPTRQLTVDEQTAAVQILRTLLKHFAEPGKLDEVIGDD